MNRYFYMAANHLAGVLAHVLVVSKTALEYAMKKWCRAIVRLFLVHLPFWGNAQARPLTQAEVVERMVGKSITTRSFGMKVQLRFNANGSLFAQTLLGTYTGSWTRGMGNAICSTFDNGPARGTQCNTYFQTGENTYRTSSGTDFAVN